MKKSILNLGGNLYDKDGNLLRKGPLKPVTISELEQMIDECPDEGRPGCPKAKQNMIMYLWGMYNKYGNPHEKELIDRINQASESKTTPEEINNKLNELNDTIEPTYNTDTTDDEYVEFTEAA